MAASEAGSKQGPLATPLAGWLGPARVWFVLGALVSLLGFALPWFRISTSYRWWYGGWYLLTTNEPGLWWISIIFLGYAILALVGYWLLGLGPAGAGTVAALTIGVALGTLIVVALAAADAVNSQGRVYFIDMNLGLFLMIPGHAVMIAAALACLMLHLIASVVPAGRPESPIEPEHPSA